MKGLYVILAGLMMCVCSTSMFAITEKAPASSPPSQSTTRQHNVIMVNNAWSDRVHLQQICVYFNKTPWRQAVCQNLNSAHTAFVLPESKRLSDIQRIVIYGVNQYYKNHQVSACVPYHNYRNISNKILHDNEKYVVMISYVTGDDMVCDLYP